MGDQLGFSSFFLLSEKKKKKVYFQSLRGFSMAQQVKNPLAIKSTGDNSIPGSGRSPGGGKGNSFQHSCLENPIDRGA